MRRATPILGYPPPVAQDRRDSDFPSVAMHHRGPAAFPPPFPPQGFEPRCIAQPHLAGLSRGEARMSVCGGKAMVKIAPPRSEARAARRRRFCAAALALLGIRLCDGQNERPSTRL